MKDSIFSVVNFDELRCRLCGKHVTQAGRANHGNAHVRKGEAERIPHPRIVRFVAEASK